MLLSLSVAHAGENGILIKAEDLKLEPFRDAKAVGQLTEGDAVDILNKDGGWLQVKSSKGVGWVRMLSIRKGDISKSSGSNIGSLVALASGRAGTGKVVATTGVRGLNEEKLKAAKFNGKAVSLVESYVTSPEEAQLFANQSKLVTHEVEYLQEIGVDK